MANSVMAKQSKLIILLLTITLGCSIFFIFGYQKKYENELKGLRKKFIVSSRARKTLQAALVRSTIKKNRYRVFLRDEQKRREALEARFEKLFSEVTAGRERLSNLADRNEGLEKKLAGIEEEKSYLWERLDYFKKVHDNLQHKISRLLTKRSVELGQVVVTPSSMEGKILKADRSHNFVIIDLGKNDGIKEGMKLAAFRGDLHMGSILIEKVYDRLSAGKADFKWAEGALIEGDFVKGVE